MAGGGSNAVATHPTYQQIIHGDWIDGRTVVDATTPGTAEDFLSTSLVNVMNGMLTGYTPYGGEEAYDPTTDLASYEDAVDDFDTIIDALDEETDWASMITKATSSSDTAFAVTNESLIGSMTHAVADILSTMSASNVVAYLNVMTSAYEDKTEERLAVNKSRFNAGMADINGVHSSAFIIGNAILEAENAKDVNEFDAKNRLMLFDKAFTAGLKAQFDIVLRKHMARDQSVMQGVNEMNKIYLSIFGSKKDLSSFYQNYYLKSIIAQKEYQREQLEIDTNDAMWDLKVFTSGANVLGAISGSVVPTAQEMSPMQSAIGGAMAGASIGMSTGNPMLGAAGGLLGGIAGYLTSP